MTLEVVDVSIELSGRTIISDVSLKAKPGKVTVILGPNGAGKTTLLKALAGLLEPQKGRILLEGTNIYSLPLRERAKRIAYMASEPPAPGLGQTVAEYVAASKYPLQQGLALGPSSKDLEEALKVLDLLEVSNLATRPLGATSSGERQRAQLAHILLRGARALVVDEPTSFQDLRGRLLIYSLLEEQSAKGRIVVIATHDMTLASLYADYVVVINRGVKVAEGSPEAVMTPELLRRVFCVEVAMAELNGRRVPIPVKPL